MELQKGICLFCHNVKVVTISETSRVSEIICTLFSQEILNITELKNVQSSLSVCPICYHKLIILKRSRKNVEENLSNSENCCILCKSKETLFRITGWPYFDEISEDLGFKNDHFVICSDCLFYLHTRNEVKTKLISKYPKLKIKNEDQKVHRKIKTKKVENKRNKLYENSTDTNISLPNPLKQNINFNSVKKLKPLKHTKVFKGHKTVRHDSRLLNQIPYVLLKVLDAPCGGKGIQKKIVLNKSQHESAKLSNSESTVTNNFELKEYNKIFRHIRDKSFFKRKSHKYSNLKDLVVNLPRMELSGKQTLLSKFRKCKNQLEDEKLSDQLSEIQNANNTCNIQLVNSSDLNVDVSQDTDDISNTDRNTVSFAKDTNLENTYVQNKEKQKPVNDNTLQYSIDSCLPKNTKQCENSEVETPKSSETSVLDKQPHKDIITDPVDTGTTTKIEKSGASNSYDKLNEETETEIENTELPAETTNSENIDNADNRTGIKNTKENQIIDVSETSSGITGLDTDIQNNFHRENETIKSSLECDLLDNDMNSINENTRVETENMYNSEENFIKKIDHLEPAADSNKTEEENNLSTCLDNEKNRNKKNVNFVSEPTKKELKAIIKGDVGSSFTNEDQLNTLTSPTEDDKSVSSLVSEMDIPQLTDMCSKIQCESSTEENKTDDKSDVEIINQNFGLSREFDKEISCDNRTHTDSCETTDIADINSFSDFEKHEDIDMLEADKNKINSILSGLILHQEQLEDIVLEKKEGDKSESNETGVNHSNKRKLSSGDVNNVTEKKKKKVTFCEDVT